MISVRFAPYSLILDSLGTSKRSILAKVLDEEETSEPLFDQLQVMKSSTLTHPNVAGETKGEDGSEDDDSLGPELVTMLVLPVRERLHKEDTTSCQL
jgi:hypothetical protein